MLFAQSIENGSKFKVGLADLAVSRDQNISLCTFPLGACLGIAIYDPIVKVGGLMHSLLPSSSVDLQRAAHRPGTFLDTGMTALLARAEQLKAKKENLQIYVAGGARIMDDSTLFNIGQRNYEILTKLLAGLGLVIYAENVGGNTNRSMELSLATGEVRLKFSGQVITKTLCKPLTTT